VHEAVVAPKVHPEVAAPGRNDTDRLGIAARLEFLHVDDAAVAVPSDGTIGPHGIVLSFPGFGRVLRQTISSSQSCADKPRYGREELEVSGSRKKPAAAWAGRVKVLPSGKDNGRTEEFRRLATPFA
jgi:hypothetical protein